MIRGECWFKFACKGNVKSFDDQYVSNDNIFVYDLNLRKIINRSIIDVNLCKKRRIQKNFSYGSEIW